MTTPWQDHWQEIIQAYLEGGVGVLPEKSMIHYCNTNATNIFNYYGTLSKDL
jgi:hypothetical protein